MTYLHVEGKLSCLSTWNKEDELMFFGSTRAYILQGEAGSADERMVTRTSFHFFSFNYAIFLGPWSGSGEAGRPEDGGFHHGRR